MIKDNDIISPYQITMIIIMTLIGVGIFFLPYDLANSAGTNAIVMLLIGGALSIIFMNIIIYLNSRFPGKTLPDYCAEIIGVIPAKILTFIYAVYIASFIAYEVRIFNEVIKVFLLFKTPSEVIIISLILACTYAVRGGVECIGRAMEFFFPLLVIPLIIMLIPGIGSVDFSNLLPVFHGLSTKIFKALPNMALSFAGYELLLFYVGFMKEPKKAHLSATIGMIFVTIIYLILTILCFGMFGTKLLQQMVWPVLGYVRAINLPGLFIERLDGVMLGIWVFTVYTTMIALYFALTYSLSKIFGTKEQKQYALPMVPIIYFIALIPQNIGQLEKMTTYLFQYFGSILIFVVPILLLIISWIRKKGGTNK